MSLGSSNRLSGWPTYRWGPVSGILASVGFRGRECGARRADRWGECSHRVGSVTRFRQVGICEACGPAPRCDKTLTRAGRTLFAALGGSSEARRWTMRFQNQVAVITAAASGIGKATAEIIG